MHLFNRLSSVLTALVLGCFSADSTACSTDAWDGVSGGVLGGVAGVPDTLSRYSGLCAFAVNAAGFVQSNHASDQRYVARFYVLNGVENSGPVVIFRAYSDDEATSALFEISLDGSQFGINAGAAGGGSAAVAAKSGWNLVEVDWASGGSMSYWVNADSLTEPASGVVDAGSGIVQSVQLGAPEGLGGNSGALTFDAFESRRSTPVGALLVGDADGDGAVTEDDIGAIRQEFFENGFSVGTPDCNADGKVNSGDAVCVVNEGLGG